MDFQELIKNFLPSYLDLSQKNLLSQALQEMSRGSLKTFIGPNTVEMGLIQGDIVEDVPIPIFMTEGGNLKVEIQYSSGILISNSCDASASNQRLIPIDIIFAPIIPVSEYETQYRAALISNGFNVDEEKIKNFIRSLKNNEVTNLFFIPSKSDMGLNEDCVAYLDKLVSIPYEIFQRWFDQEDKIASLNLLGWYLFLVILSRHFSRTWEGIKDRGTAF